MLNEYGSSIKKWKLLLTVSFLLVANAGAADVLSDAVTVNSSLFVKASSINNRPTGFDHASAATFKIGSRSGACTAVMKVGETAFYDYRPALQLLITVVV